jgi:hypothetical protein
MRFSSIIYGRQQAKRWDTTVSGYECSEARAEIHDEVDRVLDRWRNPL